MIERITDAKALARHTGDMFSLAAEVYKGMEWIIEKIAEINESFARERSYVLPAKNEINQRIRLIKSSLDDLNECFSDLG